MGRRCIELHFVRLILKMCRENDVGITGVSPILNLFF